MTNTSYDIAQSPIGNCTISLAVIKLYLYLHGWDEMNQGVGVPGHWKSTLLFSRTLSQLEFR